MRIITSPEVIRTTVSDIKKIIKELEKLGEEIKSVNSKLPEWSDKKSEEFKMIMDKIGKLTVQPNQTLLQTVKAMEKMELAIQIYINKGF